MDPARWQRIEAVFHRAAALDAAAREAWLRAECASDPAMEAEVRALLEQDAAGASLLDRELAAVAHEVLDGSVPRLDSIGPYRIVRVLGRGGMGVVYLAERADLHSRVAIKVLRDASLSPFRRERFEREQQTLAQLTHPSIARLYDASVLPDGTPYFVMEYVDGLPLTEYCDKHGSTLRERLRLFRQVCDAVHYAHRRAVIHRDLKPSNILVARDADGDAVVKLLDFGIAKQLEGLDAPADQTQAGLLLMTPAYAAPEQLRGEPVAVYTDVYALGRLLFELLTGAPPVSLQGASPAQAEAAILAAGLVRPSTRARGRPAELAARPWMLTLSRAEWADLDVLCGTAMHPDPHRRYGTVEALMRDLDHFRRAEPLEARPDTLRYRAGKFVRRNRRPVAATGLMGAVVIATVAFYTVRLADERDRARTEASKAAQISEYLIGLFEAGDPFADDAAALDVRRLLERGERQADELADQPAVQAAILDVLGRVHTLLSEYDRAEPLLTRALELRRVHEDALDVAETLSNLGALHRQLGRFEDAEQVLREALTIRRRHLPPNHAELATNLDDLGIVLNSLGRYADAEALYRLALRIRREIYDPPHRLVAHSLNNLAVNQTDQGNFAAAELFFREALAISTVTYGSEHPRTAVDLANLGVLLETRGNYAAADSMLTEAVRVTRARLGDDHHETIFRLAQLGGTLRRKGDTQRAEEALREALRGAERVLGPEHRLVAVILNHLGQTLQDRREYAAADPKLRRALDTFRASVGERHPFTGISQCNLAWLLHLQGREAEAERLFREGLALLEQVLPPGHDMLGVQQGHFGAMLSSQGRLPEAEPLLTASFAALHAAFGADHPRTREAAERLVELYDGWGRPHHAAPYRPLAAGSVGAPQNR